MDHSSPAQLNQREAKYQSLLLARRRELYNRLHAIERDFEQPRNPDDDDRATERNNDEVLVKLGEAGQKELLAIDSALDRLKKGTFGRCVLCGGPIDEQRLDTIPHTVFCRSCIRPK